MTAAIYLLSCCQAALTSDEPEGAVEAGRRALGHWWARYPWYDPQSDGVRPIPVSTPWDWSWLWDWLNPRGGSGWGSFWSAAALQWTAWIVLIAALAVLVYLLVRAYWRGQRGSLEAAAAGERGETAADRRRIEALPGAACRTPADLMAEAQRLYQAGDFGAAIVYLFSHQLVQLDEHQLIRLARGKTNRQYLRELGPRQALGRLVEQTMVAFEDVFFGNHGLDRSRFESCWAGLGEFEALLGEEVA